MGIEMSGRCWYGTRSSGETVRLLEGHTDWVTAVGITPDGRRAMSASSGGTLRLWDLENGQSVRTLEDHADLVDAVTVTPDGQRAISASSDHTLRVWDVESGISHRCLHR